MIESLSLPFFSTVQKYLYLTEANLLVSEKMKERNILPSTRVSRELYEAFERWRSKRIPIPSKAEALRTLLKEALKRELEEARQR